MKMRPLGKTGLVVSEISFGGWQIGNDDSWEGMDEKTALALVTAALEGGITLFDTAPNYGAGESQRIIGKALEGHREDIVLVSKFGHPPVGEKDFSVDLFEAELGESLERLRTDHLDVLLLHNPPEEMFEGTDPLWESLEKAKSDGSIRHYGASLDFAREAEACLNNTGSEVLEVFFNILHQDVRSAFPLIREKGTGIICKIPLDSGWLTGKYNKDSSFDGIRSRWSDGDIARRAELVSRLGWLTDDGSELWRKAFAYLLSYEEVSCLIPGIRAMKHLETNIASSGSSLEPEQRERLERFWEEFTGGGRDLLPW
jgi:aryl-alcohol dehydrogenase-like predicted oxidoreductase